MKFHVGARALVDVNSLPAFALCKFKCSFFLPKSSLRIPHYSLTYPHFHEACARYTRIHKIVPNLVPLAVGDLGTRLDCPVSAKTKNVLQKNNCI